MEEQSRFESTARNGFILWSWIGLLGGYTSASAFFSSHLYNLAIQGYQSFEILPFESVTILILMLPLPVLAMGWFVFLQYSMLVWRFAIVESIPDSERGIWRVSMFFRYSIMFLILAWMMILGVALVPMLQYRFVA